MTRHRSFAPSTGAFVVVPEENEKSEPFSNRKQVRIFLIWWARVDCASRAAKNSPLGCFCAVFCDSAAAVRIHPCVPFCKADKTETPVPGSDTGVLAGRGWITRAAHLKKPRRGFFPRRTVRRVDAVRIHPLYKFKLVAKQKPQRICIR